LEKQFHSYALVAQAPKTLKEVEFSTPLAIWVGSEGAGLSEDLLKSTEVVRIPMAGQVESLNVGVAASLALFWAGFRGPLP